MSLRTEQTGGRAACGQPSGDRDRFRARTSVEVSRSAIDDGQRFPSLHVEFETPTCACAESALERGHYDRTFRLIVGSGREYVLHGATQPSLIIPLRGHVKITESDNARVLHTGRLLLGDGANPLRVLGGPSSLWIGLVAAGSVWRRSVDVISEQAVQLPVLFPATHLADRNVRRVALRLARRARDRAAPEVITGTVLQLIGMLLDLQAEFEPLIARCPGRTLGQRRGVFLRLQRVRNCIEWNSGLDLGITGFAQVANYSPCHFLRIFTAVFGKTPHAVLIEQRLQRAIRLVNDTSLSIAEVAHASGFEDRCAFARSFKRRFGETAKGMRDQRLADASMSPPNP